MSKEAIHRIVSDSMIVCMFAPLYNEKIMVFALSSLFGETWSVEDLEQVDMRIMSQEPLFNMREGITKKDDTLPARLLDEPKPDGPITGEVVALKELNKDYYTRPWAMI